MDINTMLTHLREERDQIDAAMLSLQRLQAGRGRRRGRPPAWMAEAKTVEAKKPAAKKAKAPAKVE